MEPPCSAFSFDGGRVEPLKNFFVPLPITCHALGNET